MAFNLWHFKISLGAKPFGVRYDEIDGFIKIYGGIRWFVLFDGWFDRTCDRIKYLISEKNGISDNSNLNIFARIRIDSHNSLRIETRLTFHNVIIHIKLVVSGYKTNCYSIFLEKGLYKDRSNTECF